MRRRKFEPRRPSVYGQVALRAGYFEQAQDAFSLYIEEFSCCGRSLRKRFFLRAEARLGLVPLERGDRAIFGSYMLLRPGWIDSYVYERIADAQTRPGDSRRRRWKITGARLWHKRSKVPLLILREKLARIDIEHGRLCRGGRAV